MNTQPARSRGTRKDDARLKRFITSLSRRSVELADSNLALRREILQRKAVEKALRQSDIHYARLLAQSDLQQQKLRRLSRRVLAVQEEERKKISRELHDVIAQTLAGITIRLAALKKEAALQTQGLSHFGRHIERTQRLVEKSVNLVQEFARELRPMVLDDLGLIPALHALLKTFAVRTGVRTHLTTSPEVEHLDTARRTALYRVAQEGLANVARHARASRVEATLRRFPESVCLMIEDDGVSFRVEEVESKSHGRRRLGLLGMRERIEMVGGRLAIDSAPGKGTRLTALVPTGKAKLGKHPLPSPPSKK